MDAAWVCQGWSYLPIHTHPPPASGELIGLSICQRAVEQPRDGAQKRGPDRDAFLQLLNPSESQPLNPGESDGAQKRGPDRDTFLKPSASEQWEACTFEEVVCAVKQHSARMACFTDGSLMKDLWIESWRAGWGLFLDMDSRPAFRLFGPVPGATQTVPTAEWTAVVVASSIWPPLASPPWSDCQQVVHAVNEIHTTIRRGGMHAGAARDALSMASRRHGGLFELQKVKAHQTPRWDMPALSLRAAIGNSYADTAAKAGACMHPRPSAVEKHVTCHAWRLATACAEAAGRILALFPTAIEQFGGRLGRVDAVGMGRARRVGVPRRSIVPPPDQHSFAAVGGAILCQRCLSRARSWRSARDRILHEACPGHSAVMAEVWHSDTRGHSLQLLSHRGLATVVCVRCGAFCSTRRSELLLSPCRGSAGISEQRKGGLARLRRGCHPDSRRDGFLDASWHLAGGELSALAF